MEVLHQIWDAVSENWTATIALILSIVALIDRIQKWASATRHWHGWAIAHRWYQSAKRKYRMRRAKNAMSAYLRQTAVRIHIGTYGICLVENGSTSERNRLSVITPAKPSWLNDYLVANALESLHGEDRVVKAELYALSNTWPPYKETYWFKHPEPGKTIVEQAKELEAESRCRVEQSPAWRDYSSCSEEPRYDISVFAETKDATTVQHGTQVTLKSNAPPCHRCWEKKARKCAITRLVDSITKYDLATTATAEVTGSNQEFQEAVAEVCTDSDCEADAVSVKKIVVHAVAIRRDQLGALPTGEKPEWTEQLMSEFKTRLSTHVNENRIENP